MAIQVTPSFSAAADCPGAPISLSVGRFLPTHAGAVAGWARTPQELFWLAPSVEPPLTAQKVIAWTRESGNPFVCLDAAGGMIGYAELNPMRNAPTHLWIGHLIIDPARRGAGLGEAFTRLLLDHAFTTLRARTVSLIVFPDNRAAIRCYLRAGFARQDDQFHAFGRSNRRHRMLHLVASPPA